MPKSIFSFQQVNLNNISKALKTLKSSNSCNHDQVTSKFIKKAQLSLTPLLVNLVNTTIKMSTFPEVLKTSKLLPIFKNHTDPTNPTTLCPISIISPLSKL